jgi:hypothetical protein
VLYRIITTPHKLSRNSKNKGNLLPPSEEVSIFLAVIIFYKLYR